jgi:MoxR-like ATPase
VTRKEDMNPIAEARDIQIQIGRIEENIQKVIIGKSDVIRLSLVTLLARGHLLIEDVPGVGKTTLARALARCFDCSFRRVQFTSDLLPSDILGVSIYNKEKEKFEFHPGPIFSNFILADEINRTTPKTQSCLLEAMNTGRLSIEKETYLLPQPFLVLATQNPTEFHGTYPLPNSQMDRFLMRIRMGYPAVEAEKEILRLGLSPSSVEQLHPVLSSDEIEHLQALAPEVEMEESLLDYLTRITGATRDHRHIELGVSPRASLALKRAAQAHAFIEGRSYVVPDDIKSLAVAVLGHRIILRHQNDNAGIVSRSGENIIRDIVDTIPVPL